MNETADTEALAKRVTDLESEVGALRARVAQLEAREPHP